MILTLKESDWMTLSYHHTKPQLNISKTDSIAIFMFAKVDRGNRFGFKCYFWKFY